MDGNMTGLVIWLICVWGCAALFAGIGIYAGKSDKPAHFWSGTTVNPKAVQDIPGYNRAMRTLWLLYSVPFWLCGVLYYWNAIAAVVLLLIVSTIGIAGLVWGYLRIEKRYVNKLLNYEDKSPEQEEKNRKAVRVSIIFTIVIFIFCGVLMFTGDVKTVVGDGDLQIDATYWGKTTIDWNDIQAVSLEEDFASGSKTGGFNSAKLELGNYTNLKCGYYLVYRYIRCKSCILLETDQGYVAVNTKTPEETEALYEAILQRVSQ